MKKYSLRPTKDRFWSLVTMIPFHECWEFPSSIDKDGYGRIYSNGKTIKAHRYSWELHFGSIPNDILVLHKCDNPGCVRPDHLFLGTQKDNAKDRDNKKRGYHQKITHCIYGHEFTKENTHLTPRNTRECKVCWIRKNFMVKKRQYGIDDTWEIQKALERLSKPSSKKSVFFKVLQSHKFSTESVGSALEAYFLENKCVTGSFPITAKQYSQTPKHRKQVRPLARDMSTKTS